MLKDSEILRRAQSLIRNRRQDFICHAIEFSEGSDDDVKEKLRRWVMHMLGGHCTYEAWVCRRHPDDYLKMKGTGRRGFRRGRLQWLDWMIAECEKEEAKHG